MNKELKLYPHQMKLMDFLKSDGKRNIISNGLGYGVTTVIKQFLDGNDSLIIDNVALRHRWEGVGEFVSFQRAVLHGIHCDPDRLIFIGEPTWTNPDSKSVKKMNEMLRLYTNVITYRHSFSSTFEFQTGNSYVVDVGR